MRRFFGQVGYVHTTEKTPGVYVPQVVARSYFGDVIRNEIQVGNGEKVNDNLSSGNSISVVADGYAINHSSSIRYVEWVGVLWKVEGVTQAHPRLILRLGGVYNGPTAPIPSGP